MTEPEIRNRLQTVFRDIFDDAQLEVHDATTRGDVAAWDSLNHVNLVVAVEKEFGVAFTTREVAALVKGGDFVRLIRQKIAG